MSKLGRVPMRLNGSDCALQHQFETLCYWRWKQEEEEIAGERLFVWVNMGLDQRGKYMKSVGFLDQDNRQSVKAGRSEVMQGCGQTGNFRVSSLAGREFPREAMQAWPQWGQLNLCNVFKNHIMDNIFDSHPETRKNENLHV